MKSTLVALAALAIGAGSLKADDLEWQLNRIERAIERQTFEEDCRYQQWRNDQWQAQQDYERAAQRQYEQYKYDHRLDWLDDLINN
jgi:hypothetical protein